MTAHRILIASAVVFFLFFGVWAARHASAAGEGAASWWALGSAAAAVGLAIYLGRVWRKG